MLSNLFHAGWKAQPSSLRGGGTRLQHRPGSQRLSASQGGRAALSNALKERGLLARTECGQGWPRSQDMRLKLSHYATSHFALDT
jgi:hypothetical protein